MMSTRIFKVSSNIWILAIVGLKPKSYAFTIHGEDEEHKKSKGVVKHKVKQELIYQNYHEALHHNKKHEITWRLHCLQRSVSK